MGGGHRVSAGRPLAPCRAGYQQPAGRPHTGREPASPASRSREPGSQPASLACLPLGRSGCPLATASPRAPRLRGQASRAVGGQARGGRARRQPRRADACERGAAQRLRHRGASSGHPAARRPAPLRAPAMRRCPSPPPHSLGSTLVSSITLGCPAGLSMAACIARGRSSNHCGGTRRAGRAPGAGQHTSDGGALPCAAPHLRARPLSLRVPH